MSTLAVARVVVCILCMTGVLGCDRANGDAAQPVGLPSVAVVQPRRADMTRAITLPGDLVGFYQADLYGKVSGYLKTISVDKGDAVKFINGTQRLRLRVKPAVQDRIRADVQRAVQQYGDRSPEYFREVRRLSLRYWAEMNRAEIFDVDTD